MRLVNVESLLGKIIKRLIKNKIKSSDLSELFNACVNRFYLTAFITACVMSSPPERTTPLAKTKS